MKTPLCRYGALQCLFHMGHFLNSVKSLAIKILNSIEIKGVLPQLCFIIWHQALVAASFLLSLFIFVYFYLFIFAKCFLSYCTFILSFL